MASILDPLAPEQKEILNKPAIDPAGMAPDVQIFLKSTMSKVYSGEINLIYPDSLINKSHYETLSEEGQGEADRKAVIFCNKLRDIKGLMDISGGPILYAEPTYQIQQLVHELKMHKEEFEKKYGDVFVI